ncbi:MAG TPA: MFS transporter [Aggregatilineaceae bacterium]|nr:MFS transporter [Aggregatilineaceae bacterium]
MNLENTPTRTTSVRFQLFAFLVARVALNTGHRMVYPFLPTFARALNVERSSIALALTARSALGFFGPIFGSLADSRGRRMAMVFGMSLFVTSMILVAVWPTYLSLFIALLLASASKQIFEPAMHAYIGDRVHYTQRGLVIAITELSWSTAFLLGMPLAGWLIARSDRWNAPFAMLAMLGAASALLLWRILPSDFVAASQRPSLAVGIRLVLEHPSALAALVVMMMISLGNEVISIVFGSWLKDDFGFEVTALGAAAAVIGFAELGGEGLVAALVDRLGKRRAVKLGISANIAASLLLPALGFSVISALVGLFLFFITYEFALVSALPLMTELVPRARATLMAGNAAFISIGRMIGALIGPFLFDWGLWANGLAAAAFSLVALAALLFVRQE